MNNREATIIPIKRCSQGHLLQGPVNYCPYCSVAVETPQPPKSGTEPRQGSAQKNDRAYRRTRQTQRHTETKAEQQNREYRTDNERPEPFIRQKTKSEKPFYGYAGAPVERKSILSGRFLMLLVLGLLIGPQLDAYFLAEQPSNAVDAPTERDLAIIPLAPEPLKLSAPSANANDSMLASANPTYTRPAIPKPEQMPDIDDLLEYMRQAAEAMAKRGSLCEGAKTEAALSRNTSIANPSTPTTQALCDQAKRLVEQRLAQYSEQLRKLKDYDQSPVKQAIKQYLHQYIDGQNQSLAKLLQKHFNNQSPLTLADLQADFQKLSTFPSYSVLEHADSYHSHPASSLNRACPDCLRQQTQFQANRALYRRAPL